MTRIRTKNRNRKAPLQRKANTREERKSIQLRDLMTFSFKDIVFDQPKGNEQNFQSWQKEGLLSDLMTKVQQVCQLTRQEAEKQQIIKVYGDFPPQNKTDFKIPKHVDENVAWATLRNIGGQRTRLAGYIIE